jgi:hypothetical protein
MPDMKIDTVAGTTSLTVASVTNIAAGLGIIILVAILF